MLNNKTAVAQELCQQFVTTQGTGAYIHNFLEKHHPPGSRP